MKTSSIRAGRWQTAAPFFMTVAIVLGAGSVGARDIPKSELTRVVGNDTQPDDEFGTSVSAFGPTLVVGAPGAGQDAGAVYVFARQSPTVWVQQAKLVAPDGALGERFGDRVSVSADTIVVSDGERRRAAHIFYRSGGTWTRRERFEYTGGLLEIAVDGPRVIIVSRNSGDANVYRRNSSLRWIQQTILRSDSGLQKFGAVQMADGMAVLGADDFSDFEENPGSAYVYTSKTVNGMDQWTRVAKLRPAGYASGPDAFGLALDIGQNRVLVGSFWEGVALDGVAYHFERQSDGTWAQIHRFGSADGGSQRCLGLNVALHFDRALVLTGCGEEEGAPLGDPNERSVDVFTRNVSTNVWSRQDRIKDVGFHRNPVALSTCGSFIGVANEDAAYVLPAESC